jgi:transposase
MTTPCERLVQFLLFPELKLESMYTPRRGLMELYVLSQQCFQACYRCASFSKSIYDHRIVRLKDAPIRDHRIILWVKKRRFYCKTCKKPFTENLPSVFRGCRITERLKRHILFLCKNFTNLHQVARTAGVSAPTVFRSFYEYLEIEKYRKINYSLPTQVGIDEHGFGRIPLGNFQYGQLYATVLVDLTHGRPYRLFPSKNPQKLFEKMQLLPGCENVRDVVMDFSQGYRNLTRALFPNAKITIDKFHALNLLTPAINRRRRRIAGDRRKNPIGNLLLANPKKLPFFVKSAIHNFLSPHSELQALYVFRKRIYCLYNCKGKARAEVALTAILTDLESCDIPELKALKKTLTSWRNEILNYFETGLTNAITEGFNNKAKLVKRMGYGYKNFNNYENRVLNACFS